MMASRLVRQNLQAALLHPRAQRPLRIAQLPLIQHRSASMQLKDAYSQLSVDGNTSLKAIKLKYYEVALRYHPDVVSAEDSHRAEERFKAAASAMATILAERGDDPANDNVLREFNPAYILDFVGQSLNRNLAADIAEVGATMAPSGPDRSGMFFMAQMMQNQREYEQEKARKEISAKALQVDGK